MRMRGRPGDAPGPAKVRRRQGAAGFVRRTPTSEGDGMSENPKGNYAEVNGLRMYYEVHGEGRPLVLLHGAYMTAGDWGPILPGLAEGRRVIAVELQGHGRTADVDRPITYEGMADDVGALIE